MIYEEYLRTTAPPGESVDNVIPEMIALAQHRKTEVRCQFNGTDLIAKPTSVKSTVYADWAQDRDRWQRAQKTAQYEKCLDDLIMSIIRVQSQDDWRLQDLRDALGSVLPPNQSF